MSGLNRCPCGQMRADECAGECGKPTVIGRQQHRDPMTAAECTRADLLHLDVVMVGPADVSMAHLLAGAFGHMCGRFLYRGALN